MDFMQRSDYYENGIDRGKPCAMQWVIYIGIHRKKTKYITIIIYSVNKWHTKLFNYN